MTPHAQRHPSPSIVRQGNQGGILRRAAIVAAIVGTGLTLINQRAALFGDGALDGAFLREKGRAGGRGAESFWRTLTGHGIAQRALITALIVGTVLTAIMMVLAGLDGGRASPVPPAQIAQVYALPLFFGALSQALSYRRARARVLSRPSRQGD